MLQSVLIRQAARGRQHEKMSTPSGYRHGVWAGQLIAWIGSSCFCSCQREHMHVHLKHKHACQRQLASPEVGHPCASVAFQRSRGAPVARASGPGSMGAPAPGTVFTARVTGQCSHACMAPCCPDPARRSSERRVQAAAVAGVPAPGRGRAQGLARSRSRSSTGGGGQARQLWGPACHAAGGAGADDEPLAVLPRPICTAPPAPHPLHTFRQALPAPAAAQQGCPASRPPSRAPPTSPACARAAAASSVSVGGREGPRRGPAAAFWGGPRETRPESVPPAALPRRQRRHRRLLQRLLARAAVAGPARGLGAPRRPSSRPRGPRAAQGRGAARGGARSAAAARRGGSVA